MDTGAAGEGASSSRPDGSSRPPGRPSGPRRRVVAALVLAWACAAAAGTWALARHSTSPGASGQPAHAWPPAAGLRLAADRPTLVMFAHARCTCTRASLEELMKLLTRCGALVDARVVVYRPDAGADWSASDLHGRAAAIPGVTVSWDDGGRIAAAFGVTTSGHVVLHDTDGRLLWSGGITKARGHAGDNAGRAAVEALLERRVVTPPSTPVFGCSIAAARDGGAP